MIWLEATIGIFIQIQKNNNVTGQELKNDREHPGLIEGG